MKMKREFVAGTVAIMASNMLLIGCASLTNPYVDMRDYSGSPPANQTAGKKQGKSIVSDVCKRPPDSMDTAVQCAEVIRGRYLEAMGDQANLVAWTGIGLIPLTAFATYVAIDGSNTSQVTSLALAGAAGYALSNWLAQPERTRIFGLGQEALQCAISAAQPFHLGKETIDNMSEHVVELRRKTGQVSSLVLSVDAALAGLGDSTSSTTRRAKSLTASARQRVTEAEALAKSATTMLVSYDQAPRQLLSTVDAINSAVNKALASTIQSLSALPGVLSGMNSMYEASAAQFAGLGPQGLAESVGLGEKSTTPPALPVDPIQVLIDAIGTLGTAITDLYTAAADVSQDVQRYSPAAPSPALQSCGLDTSRISNPLTVSTSTLSFKVGETDRKSFTATGGSEHYVFVANEEQFDIKQTPAFGGNFGVALSGSETGTFIITVKDVNGRSSDITVTVASGADGADEND